MTTLRIVTLSGTFTGVVVQGTTRSGRRHRDRRWTLETEFGKPKTLFTTSCRHGTTGTSKNRRSYSCGGCVSGEWRSCCFYWWLVIVSTVIISFFTTTTTAATVVVVIVVAATAVVGRSGILGSGIVMIKVCRSPPRLLKFAFHGQAHHGRSVGSRCGKSRRRFGQHRAGIHRPRHARCGGSIVGTLAFLFLGRARRTRC